MIEDKYQASYEDHRIYINTIKEIKQKVKIGWYEC